MAQNYMNTIYKDRNNPVVIEFTFNVPSKPDFGFSDFDEVFVSFAGTTYSDITDTDVVKIVGDNFLELYLGLEITETTTPTYFKIVGVNATYPEGYILSSKCAANLGVPRICK